MVRIQLFSLYMINKKKNLTVTKATTLGSLSSLLHLKKSTLRGLISFSSPKHVTLRKKKINKDIVGTSSKTYNTKSRKRPVFVKINNLLTSNSRLLKILTSNALLMRGWKFAHKVFKHRRNHLMSGKKLFERVPVSSLNELAVLNISWRFYRSVLAQLQPTVKPLKTKFSQSSYGFLSTNTDLTHSEYTKTSYGIKARTLTFPTYWVDNTRFSLSPKRLFTAKLASAQVSSRLGLPNANLAFPVFLSWVVTWTSGLALYTSFSATPFVQRYLKNSFMKVEKPTHQLRFRFNKSRLTLALFHDFTMKPYFQISSGVFMKFFQKKKSMRRSRALKVLMLRFLRKLLLLIKLPRIHLYVSGVPALLSLLLETLHKPLPHTIVDPLSKRLVDEINEPESFGSFSQITFNDSKPFGVVKQKKRGRVKRKIRRKLQRISKQIDK